MIRKLLLAATALAMASAASAYTYVGSYWVGAGPIWSTNYPQATLSPQDAAALLFGGVASDYVISTQQNVVDFMGWVDGYGTSQHLKWDWDNNSFGTAVAQDFKPLPLYDQSGAYSAYIGDREYFYGTPDYEYASWNYVFLADGTVPEPAAWALMITGFGLVGATMRRRRAAIA